MFIGMTRAMRSLLFVLSKDNDSPLFQGFGERYWNTQKKDDLAPNLWLFRNPHAQQLQGERK